MDTTLEKAAVEEPGVEEQMVALAKALRAEHPELDGTFATLPALEKLVKAAKRSWSEQHLRSFGAYYGETLRSAIDARWVDFETAVAITPRIADLGRGADLEAILHVNGRQLFPLAKVLKFVNQGSEDSLVAFAPTAVMMVKPLIPRSDRPVDPDSLNPDAVRLVDEFLSAPSVETAKGLRTATGGLRHAAITWVLQRRELRSEMFFPLYAEKATGRGFSKVDVGSIAARWTWRAIDAGALDEDLTLRELEPLFAVKNKLVRQHAAYVRARVGFERGDESSIDALYERGDSAMRLGIVSAFASHVNDAMMKVGVYTSVEAHTKLILAAAKGPAAVRKSMARSLQWIAGRLHVPITPVLAAIIRILEDGRPAEITFALRALSYHVYSIKHERAQWNEDMDRCLALAIEYTHADESKQKTTKTHIAASWAMRAFASLGDKLPMQHRDAMAQVTEKVERVR